MCPSDAPNGQQDSVSTADTVSRLFAWSADLMGVTDFEGNLIVANPAWHRALATHEGDSVSVFARFDEVAQATLHHAIAEVLLSGDAATEVEVTVIDPAGNAGRHAFVIRPDLDQRLLYWVARDVTERFQRDQTLRAREQFIQQIADCSPSTLYLYDLAEGRNLYCSTSATRTFGFTPDEILAFGGNLIDRIHPEDRNRLIQHGVEMLQTEPGEVRAAEYRFLDSQGEYRWIRSHQILVGPNRVLGAAEDITRARLNEDWLRESEERFRNLIEHGTDIISLLDAQGRILYESPSIHRILGYEPEELVGNLAFDLVHPDDLELVAQRFLDATTQAGVAPPVSFRFRHKNGEWRHLEAIGNNLLHDERVHAVVVTSRDVTESRLAERELRIAMDQAEAASKAKSTLLANVSHELRTPLHGALGLLELLTTTALTDEQTSHVATMRDCLEGLVQLISDILDVSQIESGKMLIDSAPLELQHVAATIESTFSRRAAEKGLEWSVSVQGDDVRVYGDRARIQQVLGCLLQNAIKFTHEGSVTLRASSQERSDGGVDVQFEVQDTGIGIPEDRLDAIFESFTQADGSTTRRYGGTGLGLAICRELVTMMGGTIVVMSRVGEGSTFAVHLPLRVATETRNTTGIDEATLHALAAGDAGFLAALCDEFEVTTRERIAALHGSVDDLHQAERLAHALKGSSMTLGAHDLAEACAQYERLAPQQSRAARQAAITQIAKLADLALADLKQYRSAEAA